MIADRNLIHILLVEDNVDFAEVIREIFAGGRETTSFEIHAATTLQGAIDSISKVSSDAILLDLTLPDSRGMSTFIKLHTRAPDVPIVILTGAADDAQAIEAIRKGAQDYIVKSEMDGRVLARVVRFAVERQRLQTELKKSALIDELTGLYSERGFSMVAEQQLRLAARNKRGFLLAVVRLDGIASTEGAVLTEQETRALCEAAELLRAAFRKSDVIARVALNEIALLAIDAPQATATILYDRVRDTVSTRSLPIKMGIAYFDPHSPCRLEELIGKAQKAIA